MTLGTAPKIGLLLFDGNEGQRISLQWTSTISASCSVYLFSPTGSQIGFSSCAGASGSILNTFLPLSGTYTIGVEASGSSGGSLNMQVGNVSDVTGTIAIDGPAVTTTTTNAGQDARLFFSSVPGQRIALQVTNVSNPTANVKLLGATGEPLSSILISTPTTRLYFMDTQSLVATGKYTFWVQHSGTNVGSEALQLTSVPLDFTGPITIGGPAVRVPTSGNTVIGQNASLTFTATAGQKVSMNISNSTYSSCNLALKDASSNTIATGSCNGGPSYVDTVTLAAGGAYTILVDPQTTATGSTTVQLNDDADLTGPIQMDGPPITTTTGIGQDTRLTFSATAGQRVVLQVTNVTNPLATVYLLKPDGSTQASISINNNPAGQDFFVNTQTLPTTGTYTVWVRHSGSNAGSETLQLNSVPPDYSASLIPGTAAQVPSSGNLAIGQNATLTFSGTAGGDESVQFTGNTLGALTVTLLKPDGSTLSSLTSSAASFSLPLQMLPNTGTYNLRLSRTIPTSGNIAVLVTLSGGSQPVPARPSASKLDPSNPLSQNLVGLFLMNEGTGTTDTNLVNGQVATFAGTSTPNWDTSGPSIVLNGSPTSLSSYLDAGTDLNFDQMPPNKMTVVAKVLLNSVQGGGFAEKTDGSNCGFQFGFDSTGELIGFVNESPSTSLYVRTGPGAVTNGQWMQMAFTWDGTVNTAAGAHIYVNGIEQPKTVSQSPTGTPGYACATNKSFRIGNASTIGGGSLNGKIAYFAVYKYRVLTSAELNQLDTQLPITTDVVTSTTESSGPVTVTTATVGQNAHVSFQGWAAQQVTVQLSSNTIGPVAVSLIAPDGTTVTSTSSPSSGFNLPTVALPLNGRYDVLIHPTSGTTGSITVNLQVPDGRAPGAVVDASNPLSQNLVGLFLMNEGSGTTDQNLVDGQLAAFSGTNVPSWNISDPSVALKGTPTSLSSYLDAGTDLNFDQMPTNKMTLVAKVFLSVSQGGGFAEKTDGSTCGFEFAADSTGELIGFIYEQTGSGSPGMYLRTAAGTVTSGQWAQVAFTWDGTVNTSAAAHFYVNGIEQAKTYVENGNGAPVSYACATNKPFRIGNASTLGLGSLNGRILYFAVYKGRILSAPELNQLDAQLPIH